MLSLSSAVWLGLRWALTEFTSVLFQINYPQETQQWSIAGAMEVSMIQRKYILFPGKYWQKYPPLCHTLYLLHFNRRNESCPLCRCRRGKRSPRAVNFLIIDQLQLEKEGPFYIHISMYSYICYIQMYISYVWYLINIIIAKLLGDWSHISFYFCEPKFPYLHNGNELYESCHLRVKYSKRISS